MSGSRSSSSSSTAEWKGRLEAGRTFLKNARELLELESGGDCRSTVALCVNSAIAYGDAITLSRIQQGNRGDHAGLLKLLRRAIGNQLTDAAERNLRSLLALKQDAAYGHRVMKKADAESALSHALRFQAFAESIVQTSGR